MTDYRFKDHNDLSGVEAEAVDLNARTEAQSLLRRYKGQTATLFRLSQILKQAAVQEYSTKKPAKPEAERTESFSNVELGLFGGNS